MDREKALEILRRAQTGWDIQEALETLIPELKESEDEKIRKDIINLIYWLKGNPSLCSQYYNDRYDDMLAYLEKQKEEEGYEAIPVESTLEYKLGFKAGKESEKQKEQKPNFDTHWENGSMVCEQKEEKVEWSDEDIEKNLIAYLRYERKSTPQEIEEKFIPYIKRIREMYQHAIKSLDRYNSLKEKIDKIAAADALEELKLVAGVRAERESKQVWSEEDEKIAKELIGMVKFHCADEHLGRYLNWLENRVKFLCPQPKQEWSEEDEKIAKEIEEELWYPGDFPDYPSKEESELYDDCQRRLDWFKNKIKSLRSQPIQLKEAYKDGFQTSRYAIASAFRNYLDENRPDGKMCLSNGECEDIDKAFKGGDWAKIMRYYEKYRPHWKPSEEQLFKLSLIAAGVPDDDDAEVLIEIYEQLVKLM